MTLRPLQAFSIILLAAVLMLSACQGAAPVPTAEVLETPSGGVPPKVTIATPIPATKAAPQPTATASGVLGVDLDSLKGLEIDFWHPWQGEVAGQTAAAVNEFNQTNEWGLHVRVRPFYGPSALADAVNQGREDPAAGLPEVAAASSEMIAGWAQGDEPLAIDLNQFITEENIGLSEAEIQAYQPLFWAQDRSGERQLGLPVLRGARVLLYNRTWAEELGFSDPPSTPEEFKEQACAAAQANNSARSLDLYGTGGWLIDTDPLTTLTWLGAFGADPIPDQEGQPYAFQSDAANEALAFLHGMVADGCAWVGRSLDKHAYFALRRAIFSTGSLSDLYDQQGWQEHAQSRDEWTLLAFPGLDGKPVIYSAGDSYAVTAASPEERLAGWLFARWMSQPRVAAKLAEALPSLPVSQPVEAQFADYRDNYPWNQILPLMDGLRPAPSLPSWRQARRLLEDAGWQVYHLPADSLTDLLPELDQAVQALISGPGD